MSEPARTNTVVLLQTLSERWRLLADERRGDREPYGVLSVSEAVHGEALEELALMLEQLRCSGLRSLLSVIGGPEGGLAGDGSRAGHPI